MSERAEIPDFFISFNKADREAATWIAWVLEKVGGHPVYFQDWDFRGNFVDHMNEGVQKCPRCVAVLSDNYFGSGFTLAEWSAYFQRDPANRASTIVPVRVGPVSNENLLAPLIYVDLTDCDEATAERRLLDHIKKAIDPTFRPVPTERPTFWQEQNKPAFPRLTKALATHNLSPYNPNFVGREEELRQIAERLSAPDDRPLVLTQAITGLGGVGKTQTALAYAHSQLANHRLVWWLDAEEPAKLAADFATLARPLGLPEEADQARLNARIRDTLQAADGWLLVFDNAEDRATLRPYLPTSGAGHILITSRCTNWQGIARTLALDVMSEPDALCLLTNADDPEATLSADDLAEAKALADDLGFLPLALAQARAFMTERGYGFADYRKLFAERLIDVMARGADGLDSTIDDKADAAARKRQRAVATTWDISIEAAAEKAPGARELLELLAFFAPEPLPRTVLAATPEALPESLRDSFARDDALVALARFSLVDATERGITTHRLVQAITREGLKQRDPAAAAERAASAAPLLVGTLPKYKPTDPRSWEHYRMLLQHHLVVAGHAEALGVEPLHVVTLLNETALYLHARASYVDSEPLYLHAGAIAEAHFGLHHPSVAMILNNLALLYQSSYRFSEAEALLRKAIGIGEIIFGPDHRNVAMYLNNLGLLYQNSGRYDLAEEIHKRAIKIGRTVLGRKDPDFAIWMNSLAELHRAVGWHNEVERGYRYSLAKRLYICAISVGEKTIGPHHLDVGTWLNNLGLLYMQMELHGDAEPIIRQALEINEKLLPPNHPQLAKAFDNYAYVLEALDRSEEAGPFRSRAQEIRDARAATGR